MFTHSTSFDCWLWECQKVGTESRWRRATEDTQTQPDAAAHTCTPLVWPDGGAGWQTSQSECFNPWPHLPQVSLLQSCCGAALE